MHVVIACAIVLCRASMSSAWSGPLCGNVTGIPSVFGKCLVAFAVSLFMLYLLLFSRDGFLQCVSGLSFMYLCNIVARSLTGIGVMSGAVISRSLIGFNVFSVS